jgi:ATP-dependent DNA helicase RecG
LLKLCKDIGVNVAYLSSNTKAKERKEILLKLAEGQIDIIVGTHSLLSSKVEFFNLAFVVIDEQHRFGVAQRTCLINKGKNAGVLTLSATPIPRSLQLAYFGDINYFTIDRRFENKTITAIVHPDKREDMWNYLYTQCITKKGQAFIVAPRIFDQEGIEQESVEELYLELTKIFPRDKIKSLHGKLNADEKQNIIDAFSQNKVSVLIATTVVEVGIDVPNANFMVIMDAESFGLATLHQLRGRVGRGGENAYCFLYTAKEIDEGLIMLTKTSDGKEIAEKDFDLRGAGDILGLSQSGSGSLQQVTTKNLAFAKEIVDKIHIEELLEELSEEINTFSLSNVSIT